MDWFDALGESFATVSTGGFSMHDASFAYYHSDAIEFMACFFMLLGGTNFGLHFFAFKHASLRQYWHDEEFRYYVGFLLSASILITLSLIHAGYFSAHPHAFVKSLFNVISMATTTGFISAPFSTWPTYIPILLMLLALIGGCAASTSGGVKVLRALLLYKQSKREMLRLLHPHAIMPIKFGKHQLSEPILQSMWGFLSAFVALFLVLMVIFMSFGNDFTTAFSAITASLSNAGAGLGRVHTTFDGLNQPSKCLLMFAMIAGRLEIFSLLILFTRPFWQK
jgi:trk system potassium uptake protein TrkH